jgi:hypothetical protein
MSNSGRVPFRRADGSTVIAVLAECDSWANHNLPWGSGPTPPPCLYRTPAGDYFRKLGIADLSRLGFSCLSGLPDRYGYVAKGAAERDIPSLLHYPAATAPTAAVTPAVKTPDGGDVAPANHVAPVTTLNSREEVERFVEEILDKNPDLPADKIANRIIKITGRSSASAVKRLSSWKANQARLNSQQNQRKIRVRPTTPEMMGRILDGREHEAWKIEQRAERQEAEAACDQLVITDLDRKRYLAANPDREGEFLRLDTWEQDHKVNTWILYPYLDD